MGPFRSARPLFPLNNMAVVHSLDLRVSFLPTFCVQPRPFWAQAVSKIIVLISNLIAMASNLEAMASNLIVCQPFGGPECADFSLSDILHRSYHPSTPRVCVKAIFHLVSSFGTLPLHASLARLTVGILKASANQACQSTNSGISRRLRLDATDATCCPASAVLRASS